MSDKQAALSPLPWALLVDRDALIRRSYLRMARGLPVRLRTVGSAEAALELIARDGAPVLLISACRLPGLDGLGFLSTVQREHPSARLVLSSGTAIRPRKGSGIAVLPKPVDRQTVLGLLGWLATEPS